jgi:hypothetical protein
MAVILFACVGLHLQLLMCGFSTHELMLFLWRLYFIELFVFHCITKLPEATLLAMCIHVSLGLHSLLILHDGALEKLQLILFVFSSQRPYVVYPPEGPRPPPPEELRERAREIARSRNQE